MSNREQPSAIKYVATGVLGESDTRHEAIGRLAKYGDWATGDVTPIVEDCLVDGYPREYPKHLGNEHYGDRNKLATKHGVVRIESESLVRFRNGNEQETVESHWEIKCPVCYRTHKSEDGTEAARSDLIDKVLDCCGTEWFPPSDWIENCETCGRDHREKHECRRPAGRAEA